MDGLIYDYPDFLFEVGDRVILKLRGQDHYRKEAIVLHRSYADVQMHRPIDRSALKYYIRFPETGYEVTHVETSLALKDIPKTNRAAAAYLSKHF